MNTITQQQFRDTVGDGSSEFSKANPGPYYQGLCLEQDRSVLIALSRLIRPRILVEIGVQWGWLAKVLLHESPWIERYIGVDILPESDPALVVQRIEVPRTDSAGGQAKGDLRFELMLQPHGSHDLSADILPQVDFVFVDGDHSYDGVLQDSRLALDLVRPGGVIAWHDYGNGSVQATRAIDEWNKIRENRLLRVQDTMVCFERITA